MGLISAAQSGTTSYQDDQDYPTLGLTPGSPHILSTIQSAHSNRTGPGLSWATLLHGQNELSSQLSDRHAFNLNRSANNGTVLNRHRQEKTCTQDLHVLLPLNHQISSRLHLFIITWLFSTIVNIANRDQVFTYIVGDRKSPTSTGLSMAKQWTSYSY